MQSSNAPVRNAAVSVLGICHRQLGPSLAALVRPDLKPAQVAILDETFAANPQQPVAPTRKVRCKSGNSGKAGKGSQDTANAHAAATGDEQGPLDLNDLLPRTDISSQVQDLLVTRNFKSGFQGAPRHKTLQCLAATIGTSQVFVFL